MRVAIIHNTSAGKGDHSADDLSEQFRAICDEVEVFGRERAEMVKALNTKPDLLVVAGGDGTVGEAIRNVFELNHVPRVPLVVLPVGTANNLARSLRIDSDAAALVRQLDSLESVKFSVGRIEAPWGSELFVESVGISPLGNILDGERSLVTRLTRSIVETMRPKDLRFGKRIEDFAREVQRAEPITLRIIADGEDLSGSYIAAEALNIPTIGPLIPLAPEANFEDGVLDLLLVSEDDRFALIDHVMSAGGAEQGGDAPEPPGIKRRVRELQMSWPQAGGHVDDRAWPEPKDWTSGMVRVTIAGSIEARRPRLHQ